MDPRHERAIERFMEVYGPVYSAWLDAQPPHARTEWVLVANDNQVEANDNFPFEEAA
jgi:hypothetical protein